MRRVKNLALFISLCCLVAACKKENETEQPFLGYSYFPVETGQSRIYQVDSIGWLGYTFDEPAQTVEIDTVNYQIKEVNAGFFNDNEGRETARIERYRRNHPGEPWVIYKVFSANLNVTNAQRLEDNVLYTKLIFPPAENERWIGQYVNSFFPNDTSFEAWEYEYEAVNEPLVINGLAFDSTITVIQKFDINLIELRDYREQYAAGIGLVFKEYRHFDYPSTSSSFIKNGFIYRETYIGSE